MFFSGDSSRQKKVDLGGRSSRERDRQKYLDETRIAREQRQRFRHHTLTAIKIQKCFRGRRAVAVARSEIRQQFCTQFGENGERADRNAFKPSSKYLCQLLFFFRANDSEDIIRLVEACRLLCQSVQASGNILDILVDGNPSTDQHIVTYRVKRFVLCCLQALHQNREQFKFQLLSTSGSADLPALLLLEIVVILTDSSFPLAGNTLDYVLEKYTFGHFRELILTVSEQGGQTSVSGAGVSHLECVLTRLAFQSTKMHYTGHEFPLKLSFPAQIMSIPFLWKQFPNLKQVVVSQALWSCYIQQIASALPGHLNLLPPDISPTLPGPACLLGNILEVARFVLSQPNCTLKMALEFATVLNFLMEELPHNFKSSTTEKSNNDEDSDMDENAGLITLSEDLEKQILNAVDTDFLKELVRILCIEVSPPGGTNSNEGPSDEEAAAVTAVCAFLHVTFMVLPLERFMTGLAYTTELVPMLWCYMKRCHLSHRWPSAEALTALCPGDAPGWMLPLSVFCPVYRHMLMIIDNEEFYEQQKPLSLRDIKDLVIILKEALWQLLWVIPSKATAVQKPIQSESSQKRFSLQSIQDKVSTVAAELLAQLQDWNSRRQFTSPYDFHAREAVDEIFFTQAASENTRAHELLKRAPFLVPFTNRVRIYTSQLAAARQQNSVHTPFARHRIRIRRDRAVEDAFNQLNGLTEVELRGMVRVTFVNEFGVEEPGVDGGGIFKDFMENITKTAFDIQYGLFKETSDHLLYPNPASGTIHAEHLQYFEFLGKILGKAMFEGILVDIPFATFFLSKLKEKHNYLHDLPSLDPELYRNLLSLKHYEGDVSQLGLYFVSEDNEFGEQKEEELLPGGKDIQVTNGNLIMFIHLVANHRLNNQIRNQSSSFLRGFKQLIQSDWISMFNEHELQLLISGSMDNMDVDDLHSNVHYAGGYSEDHPVIQLFWEVIKKFNLQQQKRFLKFVTGCSRGPLLGFKYLEPPFCIQRAAPEDAPDELLDRLPTSATCVNLLKLPPYKSKEVLENKLLYAISAEAGFDLS
ncbi:hypothetical protein SUGI_0055420 [Cryptomeria japonica]|uniref:E3 ubiquitin-protein ligase UPL6 isoform X2 n=1 Tax=Cryptomeria japonica TaxID=3369 RepID=UPI002408B921|nr:E3 ubiquitin-protein ligase UPL6 isoform X2 [Cryptomeria japonica]GLJ07012.1 hypothetical protein SUGI_0055420 [Cryptomeria japonica]